jgi:hypothetical protein
MKKLLFLITLGLVFGQSQAQNKVATSDFARRPHFYQGKTILLSNVAINTGNASSNDQSKAKSRPRPTPLQNNLNEKIWMFTATPPRCRPATGWTLINPDIPNLNSPLCFAVMTRIFDRLPQNKSFNADILVEVDVRGVSQIKRIRVLK